jgi:hypothetical protein
LLPRPRMPAHGRPDLGQLRPRAQPSTAPTQRHCLTPPSIAATVTARTEWRSGRWNSASSI